MGGVCGWFFGIYNENIIFGVFFFFIYLKESFWLIFISENQIITVEYV